MLAETQVRQPGPRSGGRAARPEPESLGLKICANPMCKHEFTPPPRNPGKRHCSSLCAVRGPRALAAAEGRRFAGGCELKYTWTPELDKILLDRYDGHRDHLDVLMAEVFDPLGFPRYLVRNRARKLGLARSKEPGWSDADVEYLREHVASTSWRAMAAHLGRTVVAVMLKAKRLALNKGTRGQDGTLTARAAGLLVGVDSHRVAEWIRDGRLRAVTRGIERPQGGIYLIRREDLRAFILAHPGEMDLRRIEGVAKHEFIRLVAGVGVDQHQVALASISAVDVVPASAPDIASAMASAETPVALPASRSPSRVREFDCCDCGKHVEEPVHRGPYSVRCFDCKRKRERRAAVCAEATASRVCKGYEGHACAETVTGPRQSRCSACRKGHKAAYMRGYWKRSEVVAKYGAATTETRAPKPVFTTATASTPVARATRKSAPALVEARTATVSRATTATRARPGARVPASVTSRPATPLSDSRRPGRASRTSHDLALRFAAARERFLEAGLSVDVGKETPALPPAARRPSVPEEGLTLGDIHRRTGLPFHLLKLRVAGGALVPVPGVLPVRYTAASVGLLERCYSLKRAGVQVQTSGRRLRDPEVQEEGMETEDEVWELDSMERK